MRQRQKLGDFCFNNKFFFFKYTNIKMSSKTELRVEKSVQRVMVSTLVNPAAADCSSRLMAVFNFSELWCPLLVKSSFAWRY